MGACPYKRVRPLGEGAVGDVHLCVDLERRRLVVVKYLRAEIHEDSEAAHRFRREAALMAGKRFDGVIQVEDWGIDDVGRTWMSMEFVDGYNPAQVVQAGDCWSVHRLLAGVGRSLDELHGLGVVHRDLKPDNILLRNCVGGGWEPVILDLGIAKWLSEEEATATGSVFGTPHYMSPEQFRDAKHVGPPTDRYALAVIAYELLSGRLPFDGRTLPELLRQHLEGIVPPLALNPRSPTMPRAQTMHGSTHELRSASRIDAFMARAMAKAPQQRFATSTQMAAAFADAAQRDDLWLTPPELTSLHSASASMNIEVAGPSGRSVFDLREGPVVLGRHERAQYVMQSPRLSRLHAVLFAHRGRCWIGDLYSQNGTRVGEQPVPAGRPVALPDDGSRLPIALYDQRLEVRVIDG